MKNNIHIRRAAILSLLAVGLGSTAVHAQAPKQRQSEDIEKSDPFLKEGITQGEAIKPIDKQAPESREKKAVASDESTKSDHAPNKHDMSIYIEEDVLPKSEELVITYVMQLNYLSSVEAERIFKAIISRSPGEGSVVTVPQGNAVVIMGKVPLIRKLAELKVIIDRPKNDLVTWSVITIQHADTAELAKSLNQLLAPELALNSNARAESDSTAEQGKQLRILADPRTKRIVIMGSRIDFLLVESLVKELDLKVDE